MHTITDLPRLFTTFTDKTTLRVQHVAQNTYTVFVTEHTGDYSTVVQTVQGQQHKQPSLIHFSKTRQDL